MHIPFLMVENLRVLPSIWKSAYLEQVLSEPMLYFKHMSGNVSHFPTVRVYRFIWLHSNLMYLHDMLSGSLGVIKFKVELVVMYFFENIHFFVI